MNAENIESYDKMKIRYTLLIIVNLILQKKVTRWICLSDKCNGVKLTIIPFENIWT